MKPASTRRRADSSESSTKGRQQVERHTSQLKRRILPKHIDGRTKEAKRFLGLVRDLAKHVADPDSPIVRARLVAAALLMMQTESMAHQVAAGHAIDPDDVVRVAHAAERALARLGAL